MPDDRATEAAASGGAALDRAAGGGPASDGAASGVAVTDRVASGGAALDRAARGGPASDGAASGGAVTDRVASGGEALDGTTLDRAAPAGSAADRTALDGAALGSAASGGSKPALTSAPNAATRRAAAAPARPTAARREGAVEGGPELADYAEPAASEPAAPEPAASEPAAAESAASEPAASEPAAFESVVAQAAATAPGAADSGVAKSAVFEASATNSGAAKTAPSGTGATKRGGIKSAAAGFAAAKSAAARFAARSGAATSTAPGSVEPEAVELDPVVPEAIAPDPVVPGSASLEAAAITPEAAEAEPVGERAPGASGTPVSDASTEAGGPAAPGSAGTTGNGTPKKPGKPRKTKLPGKDPLWAKASMIFGIVLVLLAGTVLGGMQYLTNRYNHSVTQQTLLAPQARVNQPAQEAHNALTGPLNFLLLGSDLRANNPEDGQRSDTIIIVHIPATLDRAYMISIPRDLRVEIPPFAATGFGGAHEKINGAFEYGGGGAGGVQLLSQTLTNLTGVQFDGAAVINFDGFEQAVKLLGGIDLCVDVATESHFIGYDKDGNFLAPYYGPELAYRNHDSTPLVYEPGCRHFPAYQALDYVRQRKSLPNGDYDRQRHQQQFVKAIFDEAQAQNLTSNPLKLDKFIRAVGSSLTVDTNGVSIDDLLFGLREVRPAGMRGIQVPSAPEMIGGISYVIQDSAADGLYKALKNDTLEDWASHNPTWLNQL